MSVLVVGVPWTCYAWGRCVEAAYNMARRTILQRLLRDFHDCSVDRRSRDCPEFRREFLPLLFDIFRHSKVSDRQVAPRRCCFGARLRLPPRSKSSGMLATENGVNSTVSHRNFTKYFCCANRYYFIQTAQLVHKVREIGVNKMFYLYVWRLFSKAM